jgi:hypothetical protein
MYKSCKRIFQSAKMGVTLLARMLLLISSVTLISLLALTRCGLSGAALDNGMEEGLSLD